MAGKQKKQPVMLKVLKAENNVLDSIIVRQGAIRDSVVGKDWIALEDAMQKMERLSSRFMELEEQRLNIEQDTVFAMRGIGSGSGTAAFYETAASASTAVSDDINVSKNYENPETQSENTEEIEKEPLALNFEERAALYGERKVSETLTKVRTKLARSKIENNALNAYVSAASGFLKGVFDTIIPQRKNTVYNRYGKMAKPSMQSLVIDRVF